MFIRPFVLLIALLLLAACAPAPEESPALTETPNSSVIGVPVPEFPTRELNGTEEVTPEVTEAPPPEPQLLAVIDRAEDPENGDGYGQIALLDSSGTATTVLAFTDDSTRAYPCGESPDGRYFAYYVGHETGDLYLMDGTTVSAPFASIYYSSCFFGDNFQFAPDGSRFATIDYRAEAFTKEYSDGVLRLYDSATVSEIASFDDVTAYTLSNDQAAYVRFYQNGDREGAEVGVNLWDGVENREVITLTPTGDRCRFTSASITMRNTLGILVLGQRCPNDGTNWQLYTIDFPGRIATLTASGETGGAYLGLTRTNNVFLSPNENYVYFTIPDGVTSSSGSLNVLNLTDLTVNTLIERVSLFHFGSPAEAFWLSPDGTWLATGRLTAIELDDPANPVRVDLPRSGFTTAVFGQNNLYFTDTSSNPTGDGALFTLDLALGTPQRIARGYFAGSRALISPEGQSLALTTAGYVSPEDDSVLHNDIVALDLASGEMTTLYDGGYGMLYSAEVWSWRIPNENSASG